MTSVSYTSFQGRNKCAVRSVVCRKKPKNHLTLAARGSTDVGSQSRSWTSLLGRCKGLRKGRTTLPRFGGPVVEGVRRERVAHGERCIVGSGSAKVATEENVFARTDHWGTLDVERRPACDFRCSTLSDETPQSHRLGVPVIKPNGNNWGKRSTTAFRPSSSWVTYRF